MQGRLSPVIDNQIQSFPLESWKEEFSLASDIGYEIIEWVVDTNTFEENPLHSQEGRKEIKSLQSTYDLAVHSICCDYLMDYPLTSSIESVRIDSTNYLRNLIKYSQEIGIKFVELPLVAKASLKKDEDRHTLKEILLNMSDLLSDTNTCILLETDLDPENILNLLNLIDTPHVKLNYDTGNSAYWGFRADLEISKYAQYIGNVHIKDCTPEDYSVPLGTGNVNFDTVFSLLRENGYGGDFIVQNARGSEDFQVALEAYNFTRFYIEKYFSAPQIRK